MRVNSSTKELAYDALRDRDCRCGCGARHLGVQDFQRRLVRALALVLLVACGANRVPALPASRPTEIVSVSEGVVFRAPSDGVFMTEMFFSAMLAGVEVEKKELRVQLARAETMSAIDRVQAKEATQRVAELESAASSWWERNKFVLGVLAGLAAACAVVGGVSAAAR